MIRPLSFTQISLYQQCPWCYKLQYIDGLKAKAKWYFSFGTSMHSAVERFFRVRMPPAPSLEELLQFYEQGWLSQGYESPEDEARYKEYGKEILKRFWEIHAPDFRLPIALERSFYIDIEGIKLRGFIDRVDKLDSGGLSIIDYKTSQELFTTDYLENDLQLTIYQMAAEQTWNLPVEKLTLYHLRSNTACTCLPRGKERIDQARQLVLDVAENINRGNFPATEHEFCPCDFPEHCPYYRHLHIKTEEQPDRQEPLPGIAAADAVEKYAEVQSQIKELEAQLEDIKQSIIDYSQSEGLNRVYGSKNEITYKLMERTGFSGDEVKAVLEPEGLWEKVLGLDQSLVKKLMADKATPAEIKKKLETLKRITSSYPQLRLRKTGSEEE
ncbi:MAG: PD-(D/E)XK nuclease family protein [Dehalococcoidales bacterium]|nr:PD-(D/E)XK nuclease family protein [Dehalococcoidales bacterium]